MYLPVVLTRFRHMSIRPIIKRVPNNPVEDAARAAGTADRLSVEESYFALTGSGFAVVSIVIVTGRLVLAYSVGREYTQLTAAGSQPGPRLVGSRAERRRRPTALVALPG